MFFKKFKNLTLALLLTIFIIPQSILAYSKEIIASGETVGIKLNTDGILIVGSYEINGHNSLVEAGLKTGDLISQINNKKVHTVEEMVNIITDCNCDNLKISYIRDNKTSKTTLPLYEDKGVLKTGLYVKDSVSGVGTLTFIDPKTKYFGVLGHEIADTTTGELIDIENGTIFDSKITGITRSSNGNPGEKNALLYSDKVEGNIFENTKKGIFGEYTNNIDESKLYKVAQIDDIKIGDATILTVLDGVEVGEFSIKITSVNETKDKLKNIQFEITDKTLLDKTNGIVQGMSGSPIIQEDYIIGAVTHVVVNDPHRGYGILITNMLEEAEN
ncbi:MAG: SpoIVB peptidase [Bacilli bacterium]|nr:SpoIVB peptidase [Bacilli bacterium]